MSRENDLSNEEEDIQKRTKWNAKIRNKKLKTKNLKFKNWKRCEKEKNGRNICESDEFQHIWYFQGKHPRGWDNRCRKSFNKKFRVESDEYRQNLDNFKNIIKEFKETQDDIDINTTSQETKYKSEKYLSVILFNIKKYKKLFLKYKKENEILQNANDELKKEIQDTKDELDIMKEEIEINKDNNKEIEQKFSELSNYAKQNAINYEQKIFNLKQLLFSKDEEINKLNKIIDNTDAINMKIIEELKQKLFMQEQEIKNQQKIINEMKSNQKNSNK